MSTSTSYQFTVAGNVALVANFALTAQQVLTEFLPSGTTIFPPAPRPLPRL